MKQTTQEIISTLGKRYQVYRKNLGLTQSEIAVKTGISVFTVSSFEKGLGSGLSLSNLIALFDAIDQGDQIADLLSELPDPIGELFVRRAVANKNNPSK